MAFGYARASGKIGAYAVVPGPGLAQHDRRARHRLRDQYAGPVHQRPDPVQPDRPRLRPVARDPGPAGDPARADQMGGADQPPDETGKLVNEAFRQLPTAGRARSALEMPPDIMALETESTCRRPTASAAGAARPRADRQGGGAARRRQAAADLCRQRRRRRRPRRCWRSPSCWRRRSPPIPAARASSATAITWRKTCSPAMSCGATPMSCWRSAPGSTSRRCAGASTPG